MKSIPCACTLNRRYKSCFENSLYVHENLVEEGIFLWGMYWDNIFCIIWSLCICVQSGDPPCKICVEASWIDEALALWMPARNLHLGRAVVDTMPDGSSFKDNLQWIYKFTLRSGYFAPTIDSVTFFFFFWYFLLLYIFLLAFISFLKVYFYFINFINKIYEISLL